MSLFVALLAPLAVAAPRTICLEAEIAFDDVDVGGTEDYFQTNTNRPLRGGVLMYKTSTSVVYFATHVAFDGADPGCIELDLDPTLTYDLKVPTLARVEGIDIDVVQSFTGQAWETDFAGQSFASSAPVTYVVNPGAPNRAWNVLTASSFALHRRHGGLPSTYKVTFHLTNGSGALSSPCSNGSCVSGTDIYLDDDLAHRKFAIAYAMGRTFLNFLGLQANQYDTGADNTYCGPTTAGLALHSLEHDSAAAIYGYAQFYAATVFNKTTEADCSMVSSVSADWDMQGGACYDEVESAAGHVLSCADGPTVVPRRNQRAYCAYRHVGNDPGALETVPIDWVRYLWEAQHLGASFSAITDAYETAIQSATWGTWPNVQARLALSNAGLFTLVDTGALAVEHGVTP